MSSVKPHIKVAIVDDHPMVVSGIKNMLDDFKNIEILFVLHEGISLMDKLIENTPDVLLLDIQLPDKRGDELILEIVEKFPALSILVLTNMEDMYVVKDVLDKGATGFLIKSTDQPTLIKAIEQVNGGKEFVDPKLKEEFLSFLIQEKRREQERPYLSRREREVLQYIVNGDTNKEIAQKLFLGERTVETYRYNLMKKLRVNNVALLIKKVINEKIL